MVRKTKYNQHANPFQAESNAEVSVDSKQNHMSGLAFPLTDASIKAIENFKTSGTDYVQLSIDLSKEIINVKNQSTCKSSELPNKVPEDEPRYHLFRFSHTHEGDFLKSVCKYSK